MSAPIKHLSFLLLLVSVLAGCASAQAATQMPTSVPGFVPGNNPYAPQPGDSALSDDTATFVSAAVSQTGALVQLEIAYRLPTPCHQTRVVVNPPDSTGRVNIKLYSLFAPNKACTLMALATPLQAKLDLGSFPKGHYTIFVNDEKAVDFDE